MALAEQARVREIMTGSTSDTSFDTLIGAKMSEADQQIKDELFLSAKKLGNVKSLPIIDVTNATLNGDAVPQHVKDMASNRAGALGFYAIGQNERAKVYMDISLKAIAAFTARLDAETGSVVAAVV
jgi:hypothetical protein